MNTNSFLQPTLTGLPDLGVDFSEFVNTTDSQVVGGKKTFTTAISQTVPATGATDLVRKGEFDTAVAGFVDTTTNQSITSGIKTFTICPRSLANPVASTDLVRKAYTDSIFVQLTGSAVISGVKNFTTLPTTDITATTGSQFTNLTTVNAAISASAANYVTLNTSQTITGTKFFNRAQTTYVPTVVEDIPSAGWILSNFLNLHGDQTVNDIKTFTSPIVSSTVVTTNSQVPNKLYVDNAITTAGANYVTLVGPQNVGGTKVFTVRPQVVGGLAVASSADLVNRGYTDLTYVSLTATQNVSGIKTFTTLPETSISATTANQLTNLTTVNSTISTAISPLVTTANVNQSILGTKFFDRAQTTYVPTVVDDIPNAGWIGGNFVNLNQDQTINFVKTFTNPPECSVSATTSNQLVNKTTLDTATADVVRLTGDQTLTSGIKTFNVLPESSVSATTSNQLTNKATLDAAIATTVLLSGNQTVSGVKTFNSLPECSVSAVNPNQLVNRTTLLSYVPDSVAMTSTSEITGPTILAYPPLFPDTVLYALSGVIADPNSPGTPTSPYVTIQQIGYIQVTGNDYDTVSFSVTVNRQVYNANSGTITFTGITGDTVRILDITNPSTPIVIATSSINVTQTASLVFGAAPTPVVTRSAVNFTISGASTALGKIYVIYWEATGINISGGTVGVRFDTPISTFTATTIPYNPVGLTGRLMCNYLGANEIICRNLSCGVYIYNPGSTIQAPIYKSTPNTAIWSNQAVTSGAIPAGSYQLLGAAIVGTQQFVAPTSLVNQHLLYVYPHYGILYYSGTNYTGSLVGNYKNTTTTPVLAQFSTSTGKQSIKVFYKDVEQV